jgi:hypothetical protein
MGTQFQYITMSKREQKVITIVGIGWVIGIAYFMYQTL